MANHFIDPVNGNNANTGHTMDAAWATCAYGLIGNLLSAAGDICWIRRTTAEILAAELKVAVSGNIITNPTKIIGWSRNTHAILSSDWTNGSTAVVIDDADMTYARHCGRYVTAPDGRMYMITRVVDASNIVINKEYVGTTVTNQAATIQADEDYALAQAINDSAWTIKKTDWNADADDLPSITGVPASSIAVDFGGESFLYIANLNILESNGGTMSNAGTVIGASSVIQGCLFSHTYNQKLVQYSSGPSNPPTIRRVVVIGNNAGTTQHGFTGSYILKNVAAYGLGGKGVTFDTDGHGSVFATGLNLGVEIANTGADINIATADNIFVGRGVKLGSATPVSVAGQGQFNGVFIENYQHILGQHRTWYSLGGTFSAIAGSGGVVPNQRAGGAVTLLEVANHVSAGSGTFDNSQMIVLFSHEFEATAAAKNYRYYIQSQGAIASGALVLEVEYVAGYDDTSEYDLVTATVTGAIAARADADDWSQHLETGNITPAVGSKVRIIGKTNYYHATNDFWVDPQCATDIMPDWSYGQSISVLPAWPAVTDVESAVTFNNGFLTGTFAPPAVGDVQSGVQFGAAGTEFTGTFAAPAVGDVQLGVGFGAGGTEFTGTLVLPTQSQVLLAVDFGAGGTEFTGNVTLPAVGDVQLGVTFGAGLALTGTFAAPAVGDVQSGVQYGAGGVEFTGTFGIPATTDVKLSVQYGAGGVEFTGSYVASADYPSEDDVRDGVTFDTGLQEGNLVLPAEAVVKSGTGYGTDGTELLGIMSTQTIGPSIIRGSGGTGRVVRSG